MKNNLYDTIAAISTPLGEGGISVIRISGNNSFNITKNIFSKSKYLEKNFDAEIERSHTIHFGYFFEENKILDEVLISIFKNPNSYTGEDIIEISSHGGIFVTQRLLNVIINNGARLAEPGEFTKRAFLNGKIDLSQAEAVSDLIKSKTDDAHISSINQLEGSLSLFIDSVKEDLIKTTALTELELDFAEEDLEFTSKNKLKELCKKIISDIDEIINSYISGKVIRDGVNVVIAGKPNSGKSSLFNALLKSDRAIVSNISGTTRDYLEENLIIDGMLFNLTDTAGIRMTQDVIESEGIKRSYDKIESADLVLYLIDSTQDEKDILNDLRYCENTIKNRNTLILLSKFDISNYKSFDFLKTDFITISIKDDLINLKSKMVQIINQKISTKKSSKIILTNIRHKTSLEKTRNSLFNVLESLNNNMSGEFISVDLRNALNHLGEITGEVTNDEILHYIFSRFCIGK